uniref:Uncharacterized protein n=1 Tax=Oryza rufipogon TaxID=4529 RepID=A0A0E0PA10_ORYRU
MWNSQAFKLNRLGYTRQQARGGSGRAVEGQRRPGGRGAAAGRTGEGWRRACGGGRRRPGGRRAAVGVWPRVGARPGRRARGGGG